MGKAKQRAKKKIPRFSSEGKEREFWAHADSADDVDWSKAPRITFARLKPSARTISLRLPAGLLENLKVLANERDVPYQSLLKVFLADQVREEFDPTKRRGIEIGRRV